MRRALLGTLIALIVAVSIYAYIPSRYYQPGLFTFWSKTDTSLKVNVDTANAVVRAYIKRLADSVATLKTSNDYTIMRFYGSLGTAASDSVNLTIGVNGVYEAFKPNYNMNAFNFSMIATTPSTQVSSFDNTYPMIAGIDSLYIFRVSRNVGMTDTCAISIFKVPASSGPDINDKTAGTFYDRVPFSGLKLTNAANRFFTVDVAFRRKP